MFNPDFKISIKEWHEKAPEDTDHRWTYPVTTNATLNAKAENNIF